MGYLSDFYSSYMQHDTDHDRYKAKARLICNLQYKTALEGLDVWLNLVFVEVNFDVIEVDFNKNEILMLTCGYVNMLTC